MNVTKEKVGLAVVGAGGWGKNLVRNFATLDSVDLRWVCDKNPSARGFAESQFPKTKTTAELSDVLADDRVRAVVVATDVPRHYEVALAALEAGRDVFVEKPLTMSASTSEALCEVADRNDRILMAGHLLLYHPAVDSLRRLVQSGELGSVLYLYAQRLNLGVVRREENAWWSLAPHDISVANYLLDAEPVAVSASGGVFLQREASIEDVVFATLYYPEGRLAHVHVSWLDPHKTRRLTVVGSKKMAVFDDASADQKLQLFDKGVEPPPAAATYAEGVRIRTGDIVIPALRMHEPLRRECEAFIHSVVTREKPIAHGRSALTVVRVLEAGSRSLREQGRRVDILNPSLRPPA